MIEDTTDPKSIQLTGLLALATGDVDGVISNQERAGQQQLIHSDRLPTDLSGDRADWEAIGFTLGEADPADPLFMPVTLPDGWTREGSDHSMGSYIVDALGRRRVSVFYKAAYYDRKAHASLIGVNGYVSDRIYHDQPIVTDDTWATREAVLAALKTKIAYADEQIEFWTTHDNPKYIAEHTAERDRCAAAAAHFDTA